MKKVIVFAGTNEGRKLSTFLAENGVEVTAAVATGYGSLVMPDMPFLSVKEGRLSLEEITELIKSYDYIVDATHPYAKIISENVKEAAKRCGKAVMRLVRPSLEYENVLEFSSIEAACAYLNGTEGNIFVTTGSKELLPYSKIENYRERVFVRVLPTAEAIKACSDAGFSATNIICMQGPFSENMNLATMGQINAKFLVTKETGKSGGFQEKIDAARKLGTKVILIGRPCKEEGMTLEEMFIYFQKEFGITQEEFLSHFPMFISLKNKKVVVIGGGRIATRRVQVLIRYGAELVVIAACQSESIKLLAGENKLTLIERNYLPGDLNGAFMAIAATDDRDVNEKVCNDARKEGIPVNVCDRKELCDFYFPAIFENGEVTGGLISKDGSNHKAAKETAARIREFLKNRREQT